MTFRARYAARIADWTQYELRRERRLSAAEAAGRAVRMYGTYRQWLAVVRKTRRERRGKSYWRANRHRGELHFFAKLTDAEVAAIRLDRRTQTEIARDYGVSQACISRIKAGITRRRTS
jgi:hypothetical protein